MEFGGDVLEFWWGVLLVSGPPTLRSVLELDPILLFLNSRLVILLELSACCRRNCDKKKGSDDEDEGEEEKED